ncbi:TPA: hypothetical protein JD045_10130 [Citrobacter amalonaticus]|nr:hypothetical protein [Citrobacter amalonaticus]
MGLPRQRRVRQNRVRFALCFLLLYTSSFRLPLCWLPSLTPVTYFSQLLGFAPLPPRCISNDFMSELFGSGKIQPALNLPDGLL